MAINYRHVRNYVRSLPNETVVPDRLLRKPQNLKLLEIIEFFWSAYLLFLWFSLDFHWASPMSVILMSYVVLWGSAAVLLGMEDYRYRIVTSISAFSSVCPLLCVAVLYSVYFMYVICFFVTMYALSLYFLWENVVYYKWAKGCAGESI